MEKQTMTDLDVVELIKLKDMQFHNLYIQVHDNKKQINKLAKSVESINWLRNFAKYIKAKNSKLYDEAELYANEIEEGCI